VSADSTSLNQDKERIPELLEAARARGAMVRRNSSRDGACANRNRDSAGLEVPNGLETWTLNLLLGLGYHASYSRGTAGGSEPVSHSPLDPSFFFSEAITPENLDRNNYQLFCKVKSRLGAYYADVDMTTCSDLHYRNGLCRLIWIGGHVSTSKGFSDLIHEIGNGYLVSAKFYVDFGVATNILEVAQGFGKPRIEITTSVINSVYALGPSTAKPDPRKYHHIDEEVNRDGNSLDGVIVHQLHSILTCVYRKFDST